jgi:excisionase family DNA binding protein
MPLLTIEEAAGLLRVKVTWLYERTRTNEVPHVKLGKYLRFDQDELLAWTRQFKRDGRGRGVLPHREIVLDERKRSAKG